MTVAEDTNHRARIIGENIALARHRLGINQEELARRLGMRRTDLSDWERGKHAPRQENMARLARQLQVEPWELEIPPDRRP